jgi:hypothetical protein
MERQLSNIEQELEAQAQATRPEDAMESGEFGARPAEASKGRNGRTAAESAPMETSVPARVEGPAGSLGAPTSRVRNILAAIDHADHAAFGHFGQIALENVKIRAADRGVGDPDDRIGRVLKPWRRDFFEGGGAVARAAVGDGFHGGSFQ